jgi:uncharacterized protein (TIGR03083 family)
MSTLEMIANERRLLADLLDTLTAEQLATRSLCGDWTVQQVAGHLLMPIETPLPRFLLAAVRARGNFDVANDRMSRSFARRPVAQIAAGLRAKADSRFHPPTFGHEAPLSELLLHGQDLRRPLGLTWQFPLDGLTVVLNMLAGPNAHRGFVPRGRLAGLRLQATDVDWTSGEGELVSGPGASLAYAMAGRAVALDELRGPGVDTLRAR